MKDKTEYMKFVNIGGKFKSYETEEDLIRLQSDEIDRLNEIIRKQQEQTKKCCNEECKNFDDLYVYQTPSSVTLSSKPVKKVEIEDE